MEDEPVNRSKTFVNDTRRAYNQKCAVSGVDVIQCDVAHIMPLNGKDGQTNWENPTILDTERNGILLSKDIHYLFDELIWCPNPHKASSCHKKGFSTYEIEISDKFEGKEFSIRKHYHVQLKSWSHTFLVKAYERYRKFNYPEEFEEGAEELEEREIINKIICPLPCGKDITNIKNHKCRHTSKER